MYLCSENKGAVTAQLICAFVFAYAKSSFSHDASQILHDCIYDRHYDVVSRQHSVVRVQIIVLPKHITKKAHLLSLTSH